MRAPPPLVHVVVDYGVGDLAFSEVRQRLLAHLPGVTIAATPVGAGVGRATVSDGTFEVPEGELSFAPGSSGWRLRAGGSRRFYELFLRGGGAARHFRGPGTGAVVEIEADS